MDKTLSCCFTGYRPEKFSFNFKTGTAEYNNFENRLTAAILSLYDSGYSIFYSGVARGFDLVAAEIVLLLKKSGKPISLCCVVPYRQQAQGWSIEWKKRYLEVLKKADETVLLSDKYFNGCFANRNNYMIERSDAVIAYYDGVSGGTASTVKAAEKNGLNIINIAEEYDQLRFI